jgi:hypothetical protein
MLLQMANPDYATLLPQIQAETDATKKQALIDECYQFKEELTLEERSLFSYFTPDNDNELVDYVTDNPGLTGGNEYVAYVGDYYNEYGQSTSNTDNKFGGPFYIFGTGASGFGTGSQGFFYPLYTSTEQIVGPYHIHTFVEYPGFSFYMPNSSMNHAVETRPTDMFEYSDTDFVATPVVVVEYSAPVQQQQDDSGDAGGDDSGDSESTTTTQTVAIALPSVDGTTNNYGGITGLTITRATTSSSSSSQLGPYTTSTISKGASISVGSSSDSTFIANDLYNMTDGDTSSGVKVTVSGVGGYYSSQDFTIQSPGTNLSIGSGPYTITNTSSPNVGVRLRYYYTRTTTTSTTTYSFTNNTGYSATIEGTTLANGAGPTEITITGDVDVTYTTGS